MNMPETEYRLPTAIFRDKVREFAGEIYSLLLSHLKEAVFVLIIILIIVLVFVIKNRMMAYRAKRLKPESTNDWFDWKEFREWQEEQKRE